MKTKLVSRNSYFNSPILPTKTIAYYYGNNFYCRAGNNYYIDGNKTSPFTEIVYSSGFYKSNNSSGVNNVLYYDIELTREEICQLKEEIDLFISLDKYQQEKPISVLPKEHDESLVGSYINLLTNDNISDTKILFDDYSFNNNYLSGEYSSSGYLFGDYLFKKNIPNIQCASFWAKNGNNKLMDYYVLISGGNHFKNLEIYSGSSPLDYYSFGIKINEPICLEYLDFYDTTKTENWIVDNYYKSLEKETGVLIHLCDYNGDLSKYNRAITGGSNSEYLSGSTSFENFSYKSYSYWHYPNPTNGGWSYYVNVTGKKYLNSNETTGNFPIYVSGGIISGLTSDHYTDFKMFNEELAESYIKKYYQKNKNFY